MPTRETGTILAALRHWQHVLACKKPSAAEFKEIAAIATDSGTFNGLSLEEIDALCEKINFDDITATPAESPMDAELASKYRTAALDIASSTEGLDIDADAKVSLGSEPGAYVQGWIWITNEEAGIEPEEAKP